MSYLPQICPVFQGIQVWEKKNVVQVKGCILFRPYGYIAEKLTYFFISPLKNNFHTKVWFKAISSIISSTPTSWVENNSTK